MLKQLITYTAHYLLSFDDMIMQMQENSLLQFWNSKEGIQKLLQQYKYNKFIDPGDDRCYIY